MSFTIEFLGGLTLTTCSRELDEKAAIQRKREEEAEAKSRAKKAGSRMPERTAAIRSDSSERPAGPPRLALAGNNKPTWRERQAQKDAESGASNSQVPPAAPSSDVASAAEAQLPKKTGYVLPAKRGDMPRGRSNAEPTSVPREVSSGGDTSARWGPRENSGRDGSPADKPLPRFNDSMRRRPEGAGLREQSPADGASLSKLGIELQRDSSVSARSESPAGNVAPTPGKYVPVHLRNKGA